MRLAKFQIKRTFRASLTSNTLVWLASSSFVSHLSSIAVEQRSIRAALNEPLASVVVATALPDDPSRLATLEKHKSVFFSEEIFFKKKNVGAEVAAAATVAVAECKSGAVMSRDNYTLGFAFTSMCHRRGNWPCQPDQLCSWAMIGLGGGYNRRRKWRKTPGIFPEGRAVLSRTRSRDFSRRACRRR